MPGSKRDDEVARGAESPPLASLRQLAASLPSFDQALDDFIARAHQTDPAVGDAAGTYRNEPAAEDSVTRVQTTGRALDDSIMRIQPGEIAVGDDDVIASEPAPDVTDPDVDPTNPEQDRKSVV